MAEDRVKTLPEDLHQRLAAVRLLLLDVDGVLTDGGLYYAQSGEEMKRFDVRDGAGLWMARHLGLELGLITGKTSQIVARRAEELGMTRVVQGAFDKNAALKDVLADGAYALSEVAYVGDDVLDLPVLRQVGFSACPADAHPWVKRRVNYICSLGGGRGAVREVVDLWLEATGRSETVRQRFGGEEEPHA